MADVAPDQPAQLSDPSPNADRPPRLGSCINQREVEPDREADLSAALPYGASVSSDRLSEIVEWVCTMLEDDNGFAGVWEAPAGQHPNPTELASAPNGVKEERWAKALETLFLGTAYGGPDIAARFTKAGASGGSGHRYIFQRFVNRDENGIVDVDDPACSLVVACQHLTTYGVLSRGVRFDTEMLNAGIPASQTAFSLPVYKERWFSPAPIKVVNKAGQPTFTSITSADAHNAEHLHAKVPGFGAGTIYTYNPARFTQFVVAEVPESALKKDSSGEPVRENDSYSMTALAATKLVLEVQATVKDTERSTRKVVEEYNRRMGGLLPRQQLPLPGDILNEIEERMAPKLDVPEETKNHMGIYTVHVPLQVQLDGSHVTMVLRRFTTSKGKQAVQLLDATAQTAPGTGPIQPLDYRAFERVGSGRGIFGGEAYARVPGGVGNFVGMGTCPPMTEADLMVDNMRRTRPVGLARLVIAEREAGNPDHYVPKPITIDDIYFVSKMIPMWSADDPYRNFTIARLLWSLRNTPYRKELQAFWIIYAPRGALADVMWASGSRGYRLEGLRQAWCRHLAQDKDEKLSTSRDLMAVAIVSHDEKGLAMQYWRDHAMKAGAGEGGIPKLIREVFVQTGSPPMGELTKRQKELEKQNREEVTRRRKAQEKIAGERTRIIARYQKGDRSRIDELPLLQKQIEEIWAQPYPGAAELLEMAAAPLIDRFKHPLMDARNDPQASLLKASLAADESFPLPRSLQ